MQLTLMVLGINHKTAKVAVREQLAVEKHVVPEILKKLLAFSGVLEAAFVTTCNRTELYLGINDSKDSIVSDMQAVDSALVDHFAPELLLNHGYQLKNEEVARHLMRVAAGLDSMVLGEVEILGQLKSAYKQATGCGGIGKWLARLFQSGFATAKQIRAQTAINARPVSIATIAIKLANSLFSDLSQQKVLVIGAGTISKKILTYLTSLGVDKISIANRSAIEELNTISLEDIPTVLKDFDIVISSTGSVLPVIGKGMVEKAVKQRKHRPIFMIDLAVPRDIEPEIGELPDVYLYCLDDLESMADENQQVRLAAGSAANEIIEYEVSQFMDWMRAQSGLTVLRQFRDRAEQQRDAALKEGLKLLQAGHAPDKVLTKVVHQITNKILHEPTVSIRQASYDQDHKFLELTSQLFNLTTKY